MKDQLSLDETINLINYMNTNYLDNICKFKTYRQTVSLVTVG